MDFQDVIKQLKEDCFSVGLLSSAGDFYSETGHTIAPLVRLCRQYPQEMKGGCVADKIIGRGAASLLIWSGVQEVFALFISKPAKAMLEEHGIRLSYGELADQIYNNRGDDLCPLEKHVLQLSDIDEMAEAVFEFSDALPEHLK